MGRTCEGFQQLRSQPLSCGKTGADGQTYPDHQVCVEDEGRGEFSTSRCQPRLNHTCRKSYFMPCTPNYDPQGRLISGQEKSCPKKFK